MSSSLPHSSSSGSLISAREAAARSALWAYDFGDVTIVGHRSRWEHCVPMEDDGDRVSTVVYAEEDGSGAPMQAQFNVFFVPGTSRVAVAYEGDWHARS